MTQQITNNSSSRKILIPILALSILLLMVAWLAGTFDEKTPPSVNSTLINEFSNEHSDFFEVVSTTATIFEPIAATVEAKQATIISSRMLARIDDIKVRAGDKVKKGDLLIELEQADLNAQVLQTQQKVIALEARHKEAQQNLNRAIELFEQKLISAFDMDKAQADHQSIVADLASAKFALSQAKTTLSYASLIAPIDGLIVDRFAEPGDTAQAGAKLLSLYNPLSLRIEAQVREQLALTLSYGQQITIELPSINKTIVGEIEEIVPAANTGSRSFLIKAHINYSENLLPGMYARMLIPAGKQLQLNIPANKVAQVGQLDFVWLKTDEGIQRRFVRLGKMKANGMVNVISGLIEGEKIIMPLHNFKQYND